MGQIAKQIRELVAKAAGVEADKINLEHPELLEHGDYSTNIALVAKGGRVMAEDIAKKLEGNELIEKVEVAGPGFVNISINKGVLVRELGRVLNLGLTYGKGEWGEGQRWLIEHTSPNPNKAMHLGHLRNNVTAMAIANLWEFSGIEVIKDCIDNNRGIAIAKLMYGYSKFAKKEGVEEWYTPEEKGMRPDRFVDELYVKAAQAFESDKEVEQQVRQMVIDWEAGDTKTWEIWKKVLEYSYTGQKMTLERLGSKWDFVWHEHEHYQMGKNIVEEGLKSQVFKVGDKGAIITDLEKYKLPNTVVIKSDGTALYITQDLALTKLKKEKFQPQKMFWVIGPEQSLALEQLFAICEQLGFGKREDYTHLAYGYMSIKGQGKMASRAGNVVYIDELLDQAKTRILEVLNTRNMPQEEKDMIAEKVGVGAVKYSILKVGRLQDMAFDINESVSIEGNSGPYLQYTYARTQSVLRKSPHFAKGFAGQANIQNYIMNPEEEAIVRWIYRFPEVVEEAAGRYAPNLMANFLYELAQRYNTFYNKHSILSAEIEEQKQFRLILTETTGQVIKKGLSLLGIDVLELM